MASRLNLLLATLISGLALPVLAQALPDPTRPPGGVDGASMEGTESGLQSIIRPNGGKPRALINGELVPLGGKLGESRLVAVNADNIVLQNSDGSRDTLYLTPGISKKPRSANSTPVPRKP